jgi:hypothetical protein
VDRQRGTLPEATDEVQSFLGSRRRSISSQFSQVDAAIETPADTNGGTILGLHNIFIVLPQLLISFASSVIFRILAPGHNTAGGRANPICVVFFLGGLFALAAAALCYSLDALIDDATSTDDIADEI